MARRDDLDTLIDHLAEDDLELPSRVAAALVARYAAALGVRIDWTITPAVPSRRTTPRRSKTGGRAKARA